MPEPRGSRRISQVVVALLLGGLAFAMTVQINQDESDTYATVRGVELVELLKSLDSANERITSQIEELNTTRSTLLDSTRRSEEAERQAALRADQLAILAGSVGATGPGVQITITDPERQVDAALLLDAVQELRDAGAEVIAINGNARVVAQTAFVDDDGSIRVGGREVSRPFVIEAIGDPATMAEAMTFRGGLVDRVARRDARASVVRVDKITITALADLGTPEYARPES